MKNYVFLFISHPIPTSAPVKWYIYRTRVEYLGRKVQEVLWGLLGMEKLLGSRFLHLSLRPPCLLVSALLCLASRFFLSSLVLSFLPSFVPSFSPFLPASPSLPLSLPPHPLLSSLHPFLHLFLSSNLPSILKSSLSAPKLPSRAIHKYVSKVGKPPC